MNPNGEMPASRLSPVSDRAAVKARRVMINGLLPSGAFTPEEPDNNACSLA
jgi:hypothetical protein